MRCVFAKYESVFEGMQRWRDKHGGAAWVQSKDPYSSALLKWRPSSRLIFSLKAQHVIQLKRKKIPCRFGLNPSVETNHSGRFLSHCASARFNFTRFGSIRVISTRRLLVSRPRECMLRRSPRTRAYSPEDESVFTIPMGAYSPPIHEHLAEFGSPPGHIITTLKMTPAHLNTFYCPTPKTLHLKKPWTLHHHR
jgi:hypothetical protein